MHVRTASNPNSQAPNPNQGPSLKPQAQPMGTTRNRYENGARYRGFHPVTSSLSPVIWSLGFGISPPSRSTARAALLPLITAPSMVAGRPVSVQSPARNNP